MQLRNQPSSNSVDSVTPSADCTCFADRRHFFWHLYNYCTGRQYENATTRGLSKSRMFEIQDRVGYMRGFRKDRPGLRSKISLLLPREDCKISHVYQLCDMRECGKISKPIWRQQDNARPHVARLCQVFLANKNVQPLDWPPYSPDLSPIEHLWDQLDRQIRQRQPPPATRAQLTRALVEEWNKIPIRRINALMNSMTRRIRAVTRANGGHTRYRGASSISISKSHGSL